MSTKHFLGLTGVNIDDYCYGLKGAQEIIVYGMKIEPASKERTEQGEQFIERLLKTLQNNDKVTVNIMYCQTCVIDSLASIDSGTSYNVNLGKDGYTVLNEMVYESH